MWCQQHRARPGGAMALSSTKLPHTDARVGSPMLMLILATLGFAVNFWAWALLSPLGPKFRDTGQVGQLTESDVALMVAVPVLVGSIRRIFVGALTDRYGGRVMLPPVSLVPVLPVLLDRKSKRLKSRH